jgi:hypothetical protein
LLFFFTDLVTDISPVQALKGLKLLRCFGSQAGRGQLTDLSPLRGLPLIELHIQDTNVSDLSPLEGMPLRELSCGETNVSDLSPLKGMLLEIFVAERNTQLSDLSPLRGMPLTALHVGGTNVSDLAPVELMPLKELSIWGTQVRELTRLHDMQLTLLDCGILKFPRSGRRSGLDVLDSAQRVVQV